MTNDKVNHMLNGEVLRQAHKQLGIPMRTNVFITVYSAIAGSLILVVDYPIRFKVDNLVYSKKPFDSKASELVEGLIYGP